VVAQHEREEISRRTKAALAAAKARGTRLGCPNPQAGGLVTAARAKQAAVEAATRIAPILADIKAAGAATVREIAQALTQRGIPTPAGKANWSVSSTYLLLQRVAA